MDNDVWKSEPFFQKNLPFVMVNPVQLLERFSNDCRKTKTKAKAITPTNHNRSKPRDEPITIPSNYL